MELQSFVLVRRGCPGYYRSSAVEGPVLRQNASTAGLSAAVEGTSIGKQLWDIFQTLRTGTGKGGDHDRDGEDGEDGEDAEGW